jgi:hypothetical protein
MNVSVKLTTAERRDKTEELIKEHQWKFEVLKEENPLFIPKSAYIPRGKNEHFVSFFPSELSRQQDIYLEFVSYDLLPEDPNRTLYKLSPNLYFDEEYEKTEGANFRYLVPIKELIKIEIVNPDVDNEFEGLETLTQAQSKLSFDDLMDFPEDVKPEPSKLSDLSVDDLSVSDLTIRDLVAILHKKPVSKKEWLNKLITD